MIKQIITTLALMACTLFGQAQYVDIKLQQVSPTTEVVLTFDQQLTSVLSNVVFTLKWPQDQIVDLLNPTIDPPVSSIAPSGDVWYNEQYAYQVYAGFGFTAEQLGEPITIEIPYTGSFTPTIADDDFANSMQVNGAYYVSIGGLDVTGEILLPTKITTTVKPTNIVKFGFYDPNSGQVVIRHNKGYFDLQGRSVRVFNKADLVPLRKHD